MNKVFLIGNLTNDPEVKTTSNGINYCRFTLAVSRNYAGKDGKRETDFLTIIVWRNQADNCARYLKTGSKVAVSGSIQIRNYDDQNGKRVYVTEIAADEVQFLTTKGGNDDLAVEFDDLSPIDDGNVPF